MVLGDSKVVPGCVIFCNILVEAVTGQVLLQMPVISQHSDRPTAVGAGECVGCIDSPGYSLRDIRGRIIIVLTASPLPPHPLSDTRLLLYRLGLGVDTSYWIAEAFRWAEA